MPGNNHFACAKCGFETPSLTSFEEHIDTTHTRDNSYWCKLCGKIYGDRQPFIHHTVHECPRKLEFDHPCGFDGCTFSDQNPTVFIQHFRSAHKGKPLIPCYYCRRFFTIPVCLVTHIQDECYNRPSSTSSAQPPVARPTTSAQAQSSLNDKSDKPASSSRTGERATMRKLPESNYESDPDDPSWQPSDGQPNPSQASAGLNILSDSSSDSNTNKELSSTVPSKDRVKQISKPLQDGKTHSPTGYLEEPPKKDKYNMKPEIYRDWTHWKQELHKIKSDEALMEFSSADNICHFFRCMNPSCTFSCATKVDFVIHTHKEHCNETVRCSFCFATFPYCSTLVKHLVEQHSQRKFQCNGCFYRASTADHIKIHQRSNHPGEEPGTVFCTTPYSDDPQLPVSKMELHKTYNCSSNNCTFRSLLKTDFEKHCLAHHFNSNFYSCCYCTFESSKLEMLVSHFRSHNIHDFECDYCQFGSESREKVLQHLALNHSDLKIQMLNRLTSKDDPLGNDYSSQSPSKVTSTTNSFDSQDLVQPSGLLIPKTEGQPFRGIVQSSTPSSFALTCRVQLVNEEEHILGAETPTVRSILPDRDSDQLMSPSYSENEMPNKHSRFPELRFQLKVDSLQERKEVYMGIAKPEEAPPTITVAHEAPAPIESETRVDGDVKAFDIIEIESDSNPEVEKKHIIKNAEIVKEVETSVTVDSGIVISGIQGHASNEFETETSGSTTAATPAPGPSLAKEMSGSECISTPAEVAIQTPSESSEVTQKRPEDANSSFRSLSSDVKSSSDVTNETLNTKRGDELVASPVFSVGSGSYPTDSASMHDQNFDEDSMSNRADSYIDDASSDRMESPTPSEKNKRKKEGISSENKKNMKIWAGGGRKKAHWTAGTKMKFKCKFCELTAAYAHMFYNHAKLEHGFENFYECPTCKVSAKTTAEIINHARLVHGKLVKPTNLIFSSVREAKPSLPSSLSKPPAYVCVFCNLETPESALMVDHLHKEMHYFKYGCKHCSFRTLYPMIVIQHCRAFHQSKPETIVTYTKEHIEKWAESYVKAQKQKKLGEDVLEPSYVDDSVSENVCGMCLSSFESAKLLREHLYKHLQYMPYTCYCCDETFSSLKDMEEDHRGEHTVTPIKARQKEIKIISDWVDGIILQAKNNSNPTVAKTDEPRPLLPDVIEICSKGVKRVPYPKVNQNPSSSKKSAPQKMEQSPGRSKRLLTPKLEPSPISPKKSQPESSKKSQPEKAAKQSNIMIDLADSPPSPPPPKKKAVARAASPKPVLKVVVKKKSQTKTSSTNVLLNAVSQKLDREKRDHSREEVKKGKVTKRKESLTPEVISSDESNSSSTKLKLRRRSSQSSTQENLKKETQRETLKRKAKDYFQSVETLDDSDDQSESEVWETYNSPTSVKKQIEPPKQISENISQEKRNIEPSVRESLVAAIPKSTARKSTSNVPSKSVTSSPSKPLASITDHTPKKTARKSVSKKTESDLIKPVLPVIKTTGTARKSVSGVAKTSPPFPTTNLKSTARKSTSKPAQASLQGKLFIKSTARKSTSKPARSLQVPSTSQARNSPYAPASRYGIKAGPQDFTNLYILTKPPGSNIGVRLSAFYLRDMFSRQVKVQLQDFKPTYWL